MKYRGNEFCKHYLVCLKSNCGPGGIASRVATLPPIDFSSLGYKILCVDLWKQRKLALGLIDLNLYKQHTFELGWSFHYFFGTNNKIVKSYIFNGALSKTLLLLQKEDKDKL